MKTNREMLAVLTGSIEEKKILLDELIEKANLQGIEDGEMIILEALKKDLFKPTPIVVDMSAGLKGVGGVNI